MARADEKLGQEVAVLLRGSPAARQHQIHQRADHRPVQKLKRREALGVRFRGEQMSLPEQHYANVSRLSLLSSAPGRLLHSQIGFRLHARRLHTRLLPPGLGLHAVHVASAQELLDLLGVHPRGRYSEEKREHRGAAPPDTSRAGQEHEGKRHKPHPGADLRRPEIGAGDAEGCVRCVGAGRNRQGDSVEEEYDRGSNRV